MTSNWFNKTVEETVRQLETNEEIGRAIDEIVTLNPLGIYKKVTRQAVTA